MSKKEKSLDSEVNLVAFISLLSVLICSLLLSAVWIQIGSMDVKQSVGGQANESNKKTPMLLTRFRAGGVMEIQLKDAPGARKNLRRVRIEPLNGEPDFEKLDSHVKAVKAAVPGLTTVLIQPNSKTLYENIIKAMDRFKTYGVIDLGISPL